MVTDKKFKTKEGYCHILPEKIILTKNSQIGDTDKKSIKTNRYLIIAIYGLIFIILAYIAVANFSHKNYSVAVFPTLISVYLVYAFLNNIFASQTPVIDRKSIQKVRFVQETPFFARARFEIIFLDDKGKKKKRLVVLPGSLRGRNSETDNAYQMMIEENLIKK